MLSVYGPCIRVADGSGASADRRDPFACPKEYIDCVMMIDGERVENVSSSGSASAG